MKPIRHLNELISVVKSREKRTLAVAYGQDPHTIEAIGEAVADGFINVKITGDETKIKKVAEEKGVDYSQFEIIHQPNEIDAIKAAVNIVRNKEADFLMKGLCNSANYIRVILNKEKGLISPGEIISHTTVLEVPTYHKLMLCADVAVIPHPDLSQKVKMLQYTVRIAHRLGIEKPKAAILAAVEKVTSKLPATIDAAIISKMQQRGQLKGVLVDGPLAMDLAISKESVKIKGIKSEVAGDADIFIFPDINAGNIAYKTLSHLGGASLAAIVTGANVPCILTSRADSDESKFYSILLGAILS